MYFYINVLWEELFVVEHDAEWVDKYIKTTKHLLWMHAFYGKNEVKLEDIIGQSNLIE